jgi:hypothetical protein
MVHKENRKQFDFLSLTAVMDYIKSIDKSVLLVNPQTTMKTQQASEKWWKCIPLVQK